MADKGFDPNEHLSNLARAGDPPRLYLEAKWRLAWFRADHSDGIIDTKIERLDNDIAVVHALVSIPNGGSATGLGMCERKASERFAGRYVEKAETAAIARALAGLGFGTQYTDMEFDDSTDLSDSPIERPKAQSEGERVITLKARGECYECGAQLQTGRRALWNPENRGVIRHIHGECEEASQPEYVSEA